MKTRTNNRGKQNSVMNILFRVFHSVILIVNLTILLLLVVSGYAWKVKPEHAFISPLLCYAFPVFALANFSFIIYWLFRFKIWILIPLTGFLLTYDSYKAWFPVNILKEDLGEKSLSILTYNVKYLEYPYDEEEYEVHPAIEYIRDSGADIVCLQEVGDDVLTKFQKKRSFRKALKDYPYIRSGASEGKYSVVCLSKYPILKSKRIPYESKSNSSFVYDIKVDDDTICLINNHLESNKLNPTEKDKYNNILKVRESEQISELAKIFGRKVASATTIRSRQAIAVAEVIKEKSGKVFVCGDFNDVPGSFTYRTIRKGLKDSWIEKGNGWGNTFHENLFLFRIDYILHSEGIQCVSAKIDRIRYSDHFPLTAKFIFR